MLQEAIIGVIDSIKSYAKLNEMYEIDNTNLKGKPRFPRIKKEKNGTRNSIYKICNKDTRK